MAVDNFFKRSLAEKNSEIQKLKEEINNLKDNQEEFRLRCLRDVAHLNGMVVAYEKILKIENKDLNLEG